MKIGNAIWQIALHFQDRRTMDWLAIMTLVTILLITLLPSPQENDN
jgi:hypothetical protein